MGSFSLLPQEITDGQIDLVHRHRYIIPGAEGYGYTGEYSRLSTLYVQFPNRISRTVNFISNDSPIKTFNFKHSYHDVRISRSRFFQIFLLKKLWGVSNCNYTDFFCVYTYCSIFFVFLCQKTRNMNPYTRNAFCNWVCRISRDIFVWWS